MNKPRKQKTPATILDQQQLSDLLFEMIEPYQQIAKLLYLTASRPIEIIDLEWTYITDTTIKIEQKKTKRTNPSKTLALTDSMRSILTTIEPASAFVFQSPKKKDSPIAYMSFYREVRRAANMIGLDENVTPYSFRRTACTDMFNDAMAQGNVDPYRSVMSVSGHKTIESVIRYIAFDKQKTQRQMQSLLANRACV